MAFHWAIIGPGGIARKFAAAVNAIDGMALHGVLSRDIDRARGFCEKHGATHPCDDINVLLDDDRVDGLYIATPHRFHHEQALACLRAGKPVLCEKPLTVNAAQAESLIETARDRNVFLMEAMWTRFLPLYEQIHTWLNDGHLGAVRWINASFGISAHDRFDPTHRLLNADLAGGAILDMGIYPIAALQDLYNADPQNLRAMGDVTDQGVDLFSGATLHYGHGRVAQFMCTLLSPALNKMFIHGAEGHIEIESPFFGATRATRHLADASTTVHRPFRINGFEYQIEAAVEAIRAGRIETARMPHVQTLANARVIDTVREQINARYAFE